jgi:tetratricopeptide (TPR) repeat protein
LLAIAAIATIAGIWQFSNSKGYRARGRRRDAPGSENRGGQGGRAQRMTDTRQLTAVERKLYKESQRLLADGKIPPAARILEQLNMPREAIQCLEDHGFIDEAAKILMRMQRHNRAGVVYARHGLWDKAAQCFKLANMPLEVAKCARQANNLPVAAEYFEKVGRHEDAAKCYVDAGDFLRAGRLFLQAKLTEPAMAAFARLAKSAADQLTEQELDAIVAYIGEGHLEAGLSDLAVARNKLPDAVLALCAKGQTQQAAELYLRATADIGPQLMAEINYHDRSAEALATLFITASHYHYAGMVFERMGKFDRAAATFEKAEDFDRAAYCYERASNDAKVREMKEKAKHAPAGGSGRARHANAAFALANVAPTDQAQSHGDEAGGEEDDAGSESTAVIDMSSGVPVPARPTPPSPPPRRAAAAAPTPPPPLPAPAGGTFSLSAMDDTANDEPPAEVPPPPAPVLPFSRDAEGAEDSDAEEGDDATDTTDNEAPPLVAPSPRRDPVSFDDNKAAFHKSKFLADLDADQKTKLWNIGYTASFGNGDVVLTYNDEPKGVYIITEGSVYVFRSQGGREQVIDTIGASESFGELWLLADQPTAVRFVAATPAKIRVITREAFTELLDKDGTIARKVYKKFTMRLLKRLLAPQNNGKNQAAS